MKKNCLIVIMMVFLLVLTFSVHAEDNEEVLSEDVEVSQIVVEDNSIDDNPPEPTAPVVTQPAPTPTTRPATPDPVVTQTRAAPRITLNILNETSGIITAIEVYEIDDDGNLTRCDFIPGKFNDKIANGRLTQGRMHNITLTDDFRKIKYTQYNLFFNESVNYIEFNDSHRVFKNTWEKIIVNAKAKHLPVFATITAIITLVSGIIMLVKLFKKDKPIETPYQAKKREEREVKKEQRKERKKNRKKKIRSQKWNEQKEKISNILEKIWYVITYLPKKIIKGIVWLAEFIWNFIKAIFIICIILLGIAVLLMVILMFLL